MKTKKALGGLLGMFGSFFAFSFFAGFLLPRSLLFFTDNLNHNSNKAENRSKIKRTANENPKIYAKS